MSATIAINVDDTSVKLMLETLSDRVKNLGPGLLDAVDNIIIPHLFDASTTIWNVRTGLYSSSWYSQIIGPNTVRIGNDARNPKDGYAYSQSLEWGWLSVESPGVLYPTVYEDITLVASELITWIQDQAV